MISISCYISGSLSYGVSLYSCTELDSKYKYELNGTLDLWAEIKAGFDAIVSLSVFTEGTVLDASGSLILSHGSSFQGFGFWLSDGKVVIGVRFKEFLFFEQTWSATLFDGWELVKFNSN